MADTSAPEQLLPTSPPEVLLEHVRELNERSLRATRARRLQSEVNWLAYLGRQDQHITDQGTVESFWKHDRYPYRAENYLRGMVDTQVGRQVKELPDATAYPVTQDAFDRGAAQFAADYIEYVAFEWGVPKLIAKVCLWGWLSGEAGIKVTYDPAKEQIVLEGVRLWEFISDETAESVALGRWVTFVSHKDRYEALALARRSMAAVEAMAARYGVEAAGQRGPDLTPDDLDETDYRPGVSAETARGVELLEHWEKPSERCPQGLYVLIAGGKLVVAKPYPYMLPSRHSRGEKEAFLPIVTWSPGEVDTGPLGTTPVDDAVVQQRLHNEVLSHVAHLTKISADLRAVGPKALIDLIREGKNQFIEGDPNVMPRWMEAPRISPALWAAKEEGPSKIASVLGLNDQIAGARGWGQTQAAKQVAYIAEVDQWKLAGGTRSLQEMVEGMWELVLRETQEFMPEARQREMPGADGVKVMAFGGADLDGVTVRLEPLSGMERFTATKKQAELETAQQTGQPPPSPEENAYQSLNRKLALADLEAVLAGEPPMLEAEPELAVPVLREAYAVLIERDPEAAETCRQLAALYARQLQAAPPEMPEPGAPPVMQ